MKKYSLDIDAAAARGGWRELALLTVLHEVKCNIIRKQSFGRGVRLLQTRESLIGITVRRINSKSSFECLASFSLEPFPLVAPTQQIVSLSVIWVYSQGRMEVTQCDLQAPLPSWGSSQDDVRTFDQSLRLLRE